MGFVVLLWRLLVTHDDGSADEWDDINVFALRLTPVPASSDGYHQGGGWQLAQVLPGLLPADDGYSLQTGWRALSLETAEGEEGFKEKLPTKQMKPHLNFGH